jgi:hypothetical protein
MRLSRRKKPGKAAEPDGLNFDKKSPGENLPRAVF